MNSHIINPFKVDTQFTLQIHLIIDLITFKETTVFGSTRMQYSFYSSLPTFIGFLQKLVLQVWVMLGGPHLTSPFLRELPLQAQISPISRGRACWLLCWGKRGNVHDGLHKMGLICPNPSQRAALGKPAWSTLGKFLSAFPTDRNCLKPSGFPAPVAATSPAEKGRRIHPSSVFDITSSGTGSEYITIISKHANEINSLIKTVYKEAGFPP